jgi:hypothetical protein
MCSKDVTDMTHPKCPMCRRSIYVDCLKMLGWRQGAFTLQAHWARLMKQVDHYVRFKYDIIGDFTPCHKPVVDFERHKMKKVIGFLSMVFLDCALSGIEPGPIYSAPQVFDITDDRKWEPGQTQTFFTVSLEFGPYNHLIVVWNGPHHGLCYRVGYSADGVRVFRKVVLPYYHPDRIMARRQKRQEVAQMQTPVTRARLERYDAARRALSLEENEEFCQSLQLLGSDLVSE